MAKKKQTFNALMAYLNSLGPIGENVDMSFDKVEYFPQHWRTKNLKQIKLLPIFGTFIWWILEEYGNELYDRTDKNYNSFWVDVTIDPIDRSIKLTPKYIVYTQSKYNIRFDWRQLRNYYSLSKFMEDRDYENVEQIIINYTGHESDFDLTITYNNEVLNNEDTRFFKYDIRMMISEVLETDIWNEEAGGFGTMKLYDENSNGYLYHTWEERNVAEGEPIILTEKDFE
jgi:hypothetical protein